MYRNLASSLQNKFNPEPIRAQLGYSFDGGDTFEVMVAGDPTMYWARWDGSFGKVRHRGRVGPAGNAWVWILPEKDGVMTIQSAITEANKQYAGASAAFLENGMIPNDRFFGGHPLDLRMILQLGLRHSGLEVYFKRGWYTHKGVLYAWDDETQTLDLTTSLPSTDYMQLWCVVGIKTDVTPHELYMAVGDEISIGSDLDFEGLALVANQEFLSKDYIPLDGVRLRYDQTKLVEQDFETIGSIISFESRKQIPVVLTHQFVVEDNEQYVISEVTVDTGGELIIDGTGILHQV